MKERVYVKPRFRKLKSNEFQIFWNSLRDARKINNHGNFVLLRDIENYYESQNFLIGNGIAGFAIKDGEMISVHKNNKKAEKTAVKHILPKMVRCAFKYGAIFCDCYGDFLVNYYMSSGFIAVAKVEFEKVVDNPEDWNYEEHGSPTFYFLMRGVRNVAELDRLKAKNEIAGFDAVKDCIPWLDSFDEARDYLYDLYKQVNRLGYKKRLAFVQNYKPELKK